MSYDWEKVGPRVSRMWWKLGIIAEKQAHDLAASGHPMPALEFARLAEAALSQATGDCDSVNVSDLVRKAGQP